MGGRASITMADQVLPMGTADARVRARIRFEAEEFEQQLQRNRELRRHMGRSMTPCSRRARLLGSIAAPTPVDGDDSEEQRNYIKREAHLDERRAVTPLPELLDGDHVDDGGDDEDQQAAAGGSRRMGTVSTALLRRLTRDPSTEAATPQPAAIHALLMGIPALRTLGSSKIQAIEEALESVHFEDGDDIVKQGHMGDVFYVIESGVVDVVVHDEVVNTLGPNSYFGERALIDQDQMLGERTATCRVRGKHGARCLALAKSAFDGHVMASLSKVSRAGGDHEHNAAASTLDLAGYQLGSRGMTDLLACMQTNPPHVTRLLLSENHLKPTDQQQTEAIQQHRSSDKGRSVADDRFRRATDVSVGTAKAVNKAGRTGHCFALQEKAEQRRKDKDRQKQYLLDKVVLMQREWRRHRRRNGPVLKSAPGYSSMPGGLAAAAQKLSLLTAIEATVQLLTLFLSDLEILDLSNNALGFAGCLMIADALSTSNGLTHLIMRECNAGDDGVAAVLDSVSRCSPALRVLDLQRNGLGTSENGKIGGTAALANLLANGCCDLHELRLGFNNLRLAHIETIAAVLRSPGQTLSRLDLSWNSLGNGGAILLADALRTNAGLVTLNLTHNGIKERGAFVLADMLKENRRLRRVILDKNPIGQRGARSVLRCMRKLTSFGWKRDISILRCNVYYTDISDAMFDPQEAGGYHELDLSDPYQRTVAWELVELAWDEDGENWFGETLNGEAYDLPEPPDGEIWTRDTFDLPKRGILRLTYMKTMRTPRYKDVIENGMLQRLLINMTHKTITDGGLRLLKLSASEFYFTASMVGDLTALMKDSVSRAEIACALLPRVVDIMNIKSQAYDILTDGELSVVEHNMGALFHFHRSNPTGHYKLHLGNRFDRQIAMQIAQISAEQSFDRKSKDLYDTSQKRDMDNFRNETLDGKPHDFEVDDLSAGGIKYGTLEFDFVSTDVSHRDALIPCMPDEIFDAFLSDLHDVNKSVLLHKTTPGSQKQLSTPSLTRTGRGMHELCVTVISGDGLLAMDRRGTSDPYVILRLGQTQLQTSVAKKTLTPKWNEQFEFEVESSESLLSVHCYDWDLNGEDDSMGSGVIELIGIDNEPNDYAPLGCIRNIKILEGGELAGSLKLWLRLWQPRMLKIDAVLRVQKLWRGYASRRIRQRLVVVIEETHRASTLCGGQTQARMAEHERMRRLSRKHLASIDPKSENSVSLHASPHAEPNPDSDEDELATGALDFRGKDWRSKLTANRAKLISRKRRPWWVPSIGANVEARSKNHRNAVIFDRQEQMIRHASAFYFFSTKQVVQLLQLVPDDHTYASDPLVGKPTGKRHVERLVTLFSVIADIENVSFRDLLGHTTYDADGNHFVTFEELAAIIKTPTPFVQLTNRLGSANLFNALRPEGEYALDLRVPDQRQVAQLLVVLSTEPGENMQYETYNGMPFEVGAKWLSAVPEVGFFCCEYVTPRGCASVTLRASISQRLLMPGRGRWKCIPRSDRVAKEDPTCKTWADSDTHKSLDAEDGMPKEGQWMFDADGSLVEARASAAAILLTQHAKAAARKAKAKAKARVRLSAEERKAAEIKQVADSNLSLAVSISLKYLALKMKKNGAAKATSDPRDREMENLFEELVRIVSKNWRRVRTKFKSVQIMARASRSASLRYTGPPSLDNANLPEQDDEQEEELPPGKNWQSGLTVEPLQFLSEEEVVDTDSDLENV
jgi:hypothetical protein